MKIEFTPKAEPVCDPYTGEILYFSEVNACRKILKNIIAELEEGYLAKLIKDDNGNKIGRWEI